VLSKLEIENACNYQIQFAISKRIEELAALIIAVDNIRMLKVWHQNGLGVMSHFLIHAAVSLGSIESTSVQVYTSAYANDQR
jgi:hypothetical protein